MIGEGLSRLFLINFCCSAWTGQAGGAGAIGSAPRSGGDPAQARGGGGARGEECALSLGYCLVVESLFMFSWVFELVLLSGWPSRSLFMFSRVGHYLCSVG